MRRTMVAVVVFLGCGLGGALQATPDVNLDQALDVVDVQATVNLILSQSQSEWAGQGDVNKDQMVDVVDVQMLVNEILGVSAAALSIPDPGPVLTVSAGIPWTRRVFALGGGSAARTFTLAVGAPAWLTVTGDGVLSGTAPAVGTFPFLLWVANGTSSHSRPLVLLAGNQAPVVRDEIVYVTAGTTYTSPTSGVLANDTDLDGHQLTAVKIMDPLIGQLVLVATGYFSWSVPSNAEGTHGMAYEVSDGYGGSVRGAVKFVVIPQGDTELRAEELVFPGIVQSGTSVRVVVSYRMPANQAIVAATASIENTAAVSAMNPYSEASMGSAVDVWSGVISTAGMMAGVHRITVVASSPGYSNIVRNYRIVVHSGATLRVGPGAFASVSSAVSAASPGDAVIIEPGAYLGTTSMALSPPAGGVTGCPHGFHAARASNGVLLCSSGQTKTLYGMTVHQSDLSMTFPPSAVQSQGSGSKAIIVSCNLLGGPVQANLRAPNAVEVYNNGRCELFDCRIVDWFSAENNGSGSSSPTLSTGAAITISTGGKATVEDCLFLRCGHVSAGSGRIGGAIVVQSPFYGQFTSVLNAKRCVFRGCYLRSNETASGGAIGVTWATANLEECHFEENQIHYPSVVFPPSTNSTESYMSGGAISAYQWGMVNLYRCTFDGNSAQTLAATQGNYRVRSGGGAIAAIGHSSVVADQCVFRNNFVRLSTGFPEFVRGSVATVQRGSALRIENSLVVNNGGNDSGKTPAAPLQVGGSDVGQNVEANVGARLTIVNCLLTGNMGDSACSLIRSEVPTSVSSPVANVVTLIHCTVSNPSPLLTNGQVSGALLLGTFGNLSVRDCIFWAPTIPAVSWAGGSALMIHTAVGPMTSTGVTTAVNNLSTDPLLDSSGSWLLLPGSPAIDAGSTLAQVSGLGMRSALANLSPDTGQSDLGYHAPMPNAGVIPFTSMDAYTMAHQLALHSAYSAPPPP